MNKRAAPAGRAAPGPRAPLQCAAPAAGWQHRPRFPPAIPGCPRWAPPEVRRDPAGRHLRLECGPGADPGNRPWEQNPLAAPGTAPASSPGPGPSPGLTPGPSRPPGAPVPAQCGARKRTSDPQKCCF